MDRRTLLADVGVGLVAHGGVRALTHRAVDTGADLPAGSTSYYARTRRDLTALVVDRVTAQLSAELEALTVPDELDGDTVVGIAAAFLEQMAARTDAQAARLALLLELRDDEELRRPLTGADPVRVRLHETARTLLVALGVADPYRAAVDLVGLIDAVLLYRTARVAPLDATAVLTAFITGLERR